MTWVDTSIILTIDIWGSITKFGNDNISLLYFMNFV